MNPVITTAEQFWYMLDDTHEDLCDEWDYWDETLSNDWDDDLHRPDDYLINCYIRHRKYPMKFQVTKKAMDEYIQKCMDDKFLVKAYKGALEKDKPTITTFT